MTLHFAVLALKNHAASPQNVHLLAKRQSDSWIALLLHCYRDAVTNRQNGAIVFRMCRHWAVEFPNWREEEKHHRLLHDAQRSLDPQQPVNSRIISLASAANVLLEYIARDEERHEEILRRAIEAASTKKP